mmetsp:Transcript_9454/g.17823  ORF Transcript_9454/g.17823 Transcript_9454/m.17823 type:complete len:89 (+) Transcript_9454:2927-3193(+)
MNLTSKGIETSKELDCLFVVEIKDNSDMASGVPCLWFDLIVKVGNTPIKSNRVKGDPNTYVLQRLRMNIMEIACQEIVHACEEICSTG